MTTDESGTVSELLDYYPYGEELPASASYSDAPETAYTYGGKEHTEDTGLSYFEARHYKPSIGKFISMDPFPRRAPEYMLPDPQSWNSYAYARNNPLVYTDPSGERATVFTWGLRFGAAAAVSDGPAPFGDAIGAGIIVISIAVTGIQAIGDLITHDNITGDLPASTTPTPAYTGEGSSIMSNPGESESGITATGFPALGGGSIGDNVMAASVSYGSVAEWVQAGDPTIAPADGFVWTGNGAVGSKEGAWYNSDTKESLYPHFDGGGHAPHADYKDGATGGKTRVYGDGTVEGKD